MHVWNLVTSAQHKLLYVCIIYADIFLEWCNLICNHMSSFLTSHTEYGRQTEKGWAPLEIKGHVVQRTSCPPEVSWPAETLPRNSEQDNASEVWALSQTGLSVWIATDLSAIGSHTVQWMGEAVYIIKIAGTGPAGGNWGLGQYNEPCVWASCCGNSVHHGLCQAVSAHS